MLFRVISTMLNSLTAVSLVEAQHSFGVHFVPDRIVSIEGTVTDFRFRNPHGMLRVAAKDDEGREVEWRAETNSPNILRRRGWSETLIGLGDVLVVEGYPARDGSRSMRIYCVISGDGHELIGQRPSAPPPGNADESNDSD